MAIRYCGNTPERDVCGDGQHHGNVSYCTTFCSAKLTVLSSMGDLIGFEGYLNTSTPFRAGEHNAIWKSDRHYTDFSFGNNELPECKYPRFYDDFGKEVTNLTTELVGCRDSEFDQYGEVGAFGNYPEWQRQISKFAFVQDRLREWRPDVRVKIEHFSCLTISMLDIDGFRIDKGLTVTVDAQAVNFRFASAHYSITDCRF